MIYNEDSIKGLDIVPAQKLSGRLVDIKSPEELFILTSTFSVYSWHSLEKVYLAVLEKHGYSYNDIGFIFPDEAAEWGESIDGIQVYNQMGEILLTEQAFKLFILKYFSAIISYAKINSDPITQVSWWSEFLNFTTDLEKN